jgi:gluconate 2-dehydrogenase gamma chain
VSETRREALRLLGSITATCCFPFASDELYGQHAHLAPDQAGATTGSPPQFFTPAEYTTLTAFVDVLIPATDTPGAAAAGVPAYIDRVVSANAQHQPLARAGLAWLTSEAQRRYSREYRALDEAQHVALLQPLSDAVDRAARETQQARYRATPSGRTYYFAVNDATPPARPAVAVQSDAADPGMPERFFRLMKNLTADGYYTSRVGLIEELGYSGNTFRASYPQCAVPEH